MLNQSANNPMSEYLLKMQAIVNQSEFFDKEEADKYETKETWEAGGIYVRAVRKTDVFESHQYAALDLYNHLIRNGIGENEAMVMVKEPMRIPMHLREEILQLKRDEIIMTYREQNRYYLRLSGQPFLGDGITANSERIVLLPDEFYRMFPSINIEKNMPIHEMPRQEQEIFMNSPLYEQVLAENPNALYLKYIGSNSIPVSVSRIAHDGDIMRVNDGKLSKQHPVFGIIHVSSAELHDFITIYHETRDYVYNHLRGDFSSLFPNYNNFMRFLTIYMAIGSAMNDFMKKSTKMIHMNNITANNYFELYGLPSVIMEGAQRTEFLKQIRLFLQDKGTNVVYRVKDIMGYEETDVFTLVMVKQQKFINGHAHYVEDQEVQTQIDMYERNRQEIIDREENENRDLTEEELEMIREYTQRIQDAKQELKKPAFDIFFRRFGKAAENTGYFEFRDEKRSWTVEEISSADPRWWDSPEVDYALNEMNYTLSNSKYIQLSTAMSMSDIWWQSVILLRSLLDNKRETHHDFIDINWFINGSTDVSVFEAVLMLVVCMGWHLSTPSGNMRNNMYRGTHNVVYKTERVRQTIRHEDGSEETKWVEQTLRDESGNPVIEGFVPGNKVMLDLLFNGFRDVLRDEDGEPILDGEGNTIPDNCSEDCPARDWFLAHPQRSHNGAPKPLKFGWPFKIASFNWDIRNHDPVFYRSIWQKHFLEPDIFMPMLDHVLDRVNNNIGDVMMGEAKKIFDYLEVKLRTAESIWDFRQVTDVFRNLFLVDPIRSSWYTDLDFNLNNILAERFNMTSQEIMDLRAFFHRYNADQSTMVDFIVKWNKEEYPINLFSVLNTPIYELKINDKTPFLDATFRTAFVSALRSNAQVNARVRNSQMSSGIKSNFIDIIMDKIEFELTNSEDGPMTFSALLARVNPPLHRELTRLRSQPSQMVLLIRNIIRALETYCEAHLRGLTFTALGPDEYFRILKAVITYFKSFMVEFTKTEFILLFDGLWDQGGHSNMLQMFDEIAGGKINIKPKTSIALKDVSQAKAKVLFEDHQRLGQPVQFKPHDGDQPQNHPPEVKHINQPKDVLYDSAIFRVKGPYSSFLNPNFDRWIIQPRFDLWYDDGTRVTRSPFQIHPDTIVVATLQPSEEEDKDYRVIINVNNVDTIPPGYVGNALPIPPDFNNN